jgi:abequosyltransferase
MLLDILIPTFNRAEFLKKNIAMLADWIEELKCKDKVNIIISDNCSTDLTFEIALSLQKKFDINLDLYRQDENIGLEKNTVFVFSKATSEYVMFLGDDDFLDRNYLKHVLNYIEKRFYTCILPTFLSKTVDGRVLGGGRIGKNRIFREGFLTAKKMSLLGHQLSGITLLREGTLESYLAHPRHRNIYLFISFVGFNCLRGSVLLLSEYPVDVTIGEKKDWNYGDDALFNEKIKNASVISRSFFEKVSLEHHFYLRNLDSIILLYPDFSSKLKALYLSTFTKNLTISYKFFTPFALISYVSARVLIKSFSKLGII